MKVLVVDVGTSGVRVAVIDGDGHFVLDRYEELLPSSPADGLVEIDGAALAAAVIRLALAAVDTAGPVDGVGITNQRASVVVWDAATGEPIGPGLGWQDLRTIGACLAAREHGLRLAPNQSATKVQWLLNAHAGGRDREALRVGTIDTWVIAALSRATAHVTDASNAAVTGLTDGDARDWSPTALDALGIPRATMPALVSSVGECARAEVLPGAPPIVAVLGDQQASLAGQSCVRPGVAKITFGTGGMLDTVVDAPLTVHQRMGHGTFPIVAWRAPGGATSHAAGPDTTTTWGIEAIMLAAGTNVQWLRDGLGLVTTSAETHEVAAQCRDSGGVVFVPALMGLGTPNWDYGARGTLLGVTRGTGRAEVVRAVLEGIAHRGADLVDAAVADAGISIDALRVDGGMSDNATFVQALADATQRTVEVAPVRDATTLGAALMALVALGHHRTIDDLATTWRPRVRVAPQSVLDRERWRAAVTRAERWLPELSSIEF